MGLFSKIKQGLQKTKASISDGITSIINSFTKIDEDLFEELEELLVMSDIGVETSVKICDLLREKVKQNGIKDPNQIKSLMHDIIIEMLGEDAGLKLDTKPSVILVVGVNGVGKTTTTINLAASLATLEKRVLVVDADPQANASSGLGVDIKQAECTIYECLIDGADVNRAIHDTEIETLKIISSHINLVGAEIEMLNLKNREKIMKSVLAPLKEQYDYILIDCSPSLGLITVNALTAADTVIIPVQAEYFALEGISKLLNTIKIIKSKLNPQLQIEGFLLTMFDSRLRQANQIYDEVKRHFQELVFKTVIQRNVKLSEAPSYGLPTILYDADSTGARNHLALAREILERENN